MTLNQVKVFEAVSRYLNMTRAAESLHISEPSVFKQLKLLEEYCGVRLYRKVGRQIELTREGRLVQADIREILLKAENLRQRFRPAFESAQGGSLVVGASHGPSVTLVPSLLTAFKDRHPSTQIVFRTRSSPEIEQLILDGRIEIGLVTKPSQSARLETVPYRRENIAIFVAAQHPLAAKKSQCTMAEFAQGPVIVRKGRGAKTWDILEQIEAHGFQLNILMECESAEALKIAVIRCAGMGILYEDHLDTELKRGEVKIITVSGLKTIESMSYIAYQKEKPLSENAREFLRLLQQWRSKRDPLNLLKTPLAKRSGPSMA